MSQLILSLLIAIFSSFVSADSAAIEPCGETLGSSTSNPAIFRGVPARSNHPYQRDPDNSCQGQGFLGYQFQCVEFIRRFYHDALGVDMSYAAGWQGNAITYLPETLVGGLNVGVGKRGLITFRNGEVCARPWLDDIIVFGNGPDGAGHVAIVGGANSDQLTLIEQNWSSTGFFSLPVNRDSTSGKWSAPPRANYTVEGWARRPLDYKLLSFEIVGNISAADGRFVDNFNDGLITEGSTASFSFIPGPGVEEGGALRLRSIDGVTVAPIFDDLLLFKLAALDQPETRLSNGRGDSGIEVLFLTDPLEPRGTPDSTDFYSLVLGEGTPNELSHLVGIVVARSTDGLQETRVSLVVPDPVGGFLTIAEDPVDLTAALGILLRLELIDDDRPTTLFDDEGNRVVASYRLSNSSQFKSADEWERFTRHGRLFESSMEAFPFVAVGYQFLPNRGGMNGACPTTVAAGAACSDSLDNDSDGFIDFPEDGACTSAGDDEEGSCGDGVCKSWIGENPFSCNADCTCDPLDPDCGVGEE